MIYLDYQATTPIAPEVRAAMAPWQEEKFANPHAPYRAGREAAVAIEIARTQVREAMGRDTGTLAFTGSATESLNWAIRGVLPVDRAHVVTLATEHAAVLDTVEHAGRRHDVTVVPVEPTGRVDLSRLKAALRPDTALVAAMLVNNEIGVIQPIAEIASLAHEVGASMLCDAVQGLGRVPIPDGPDMIAICAHKIHGPKAIGALWMADGVTPEPLIHGGGQEKGLRSGTLSPALCAGFGAAAQLARKRFDADHAHVARLWTTARDILSDWQLNGSDEDRYPGNLNVRREGLDTARLLSDNRDIAFSLGSACASGSGRPSHVLRALGLSDRQARSSIRIGFGRYTDPDELAAALRQIDESARSQ